MTVEPLPPQHVQGFAAVAGQLADSIGTVVLGKPEVVRLALTALFAQGHVLLEDVPGVGKTTLARAIAGVRTRAVAADPVHPRPAALRRLRRDDLQPGQPRASSSTPGRSSPTSSSPTRSTGPRRRPSRRCWRSWRNARVTVDGVPHPVPQPFLVVATQNPVEMDGTYRLPEAQLDRFLVKLSVGYPDEEVEIEVLRGAAQPLPRQPGTGHRHRHRRRDGPDGAARAHRRPAVRVRRPARHGHPQPPAGPGRGQPPRRHRADPGGLRVRPHRRAVATCCRRTSRRWWSRCSRTGCCSRRTRSCAGVTAGEVLDDAVAFGAGAAAGRQLSPAGVTLGPTGRGASRTCPAG